jgi:putative transposase
MFLTGVHMRAGRNFQPLSYDLRLPDAVQAAALRLLDGSRAVINATVAALWDRLDEFGERETKYAYKQVTAMIGSSDPHGDRQWRCEAEQAGRILRGQAERKKQFALILPLLEQGMILPQTEHKPAGKNRKAIKAALADLREEHSDGGSAVELQNLIEQACNFYLKHGCFPSCYEEMQTIPVLKVGILPCPTGHATPSSISVLRFLSLHFPTLSRCGGSWDGTGGCARW